LRRSVCPVRLNFPSVAHYVATGAARRFWPKWLETTPMFPTRYLRRQGSKWNFFRPTLDGGPGS
jgi:hypothetical protein